MVELENRMVAVPWDMFAPRVSKMEHNHGRAGYSEIGTGVFVPEKEAFEYAMERVSLDHELKQEFVEWFYSGNWVEEER